jgi:membrane protease YdiL (CAAX protease family)
MLGAGAMGVAFFDQVAAAEEIAFRGLLQSGLARRYGETQGWLAGSLLFGLFHASNVVFLAPDQRVDYLVKSVPFITALGAYLGWVYRERGYSLSSSAAVHFWYDFLLEAVVFALDPKNSPLAVAVSF